MPHGPPRCRGLGQHFDADIANGKSSLPVWPELLYDLCERARCRFCLLVCFVLFFLLAFLSFLFFVCFGCSRAKKGSVKCLLFLFAILFLLFLLVQNILGPC